MFLKSIYIENACIIFDSSNFFCEEKELELSSINNIVGRIGSWTIPTEEVTKE